MIYFLHLQRGFFIIVLDLRLTCLAGCREISCQSLFMRVLFVNFDKIITKYFLSYINFFNFVSRFYVMRNKLYIIFLITISFLLLQCSTDKRLHQELVKMADNLNQSAPAQLDEHTTFLGANVTEDNIFQYRYQIINTPDPQSMMQAVEEQTRANIREAFRMNPDLKIFTANNVKIDYIYTDFAGKILKTIHITPKDYK